MTLLKSTCGQKYFIYGWYSRAYENEIILEDVLGVYYWYFWRWHPVCGMVMRSIAFFPERVIQSEYFISYNRTWYTVRPGKNFAVCH